MKATTFAVLAAAAALVCASCSSPDTKPDPTPNGTTTGGGTDAPSSGAGAKTPAGLVPYTDPDMVAQAPQPKKLESAHGVVAYEVGGMTVLLKRQPAKPIVSAQLYIRGGSANLTPATQGLEQLALGVAVDGGTASKSKDDFNAALDGVGASIGSFTERDYSGLYFKTIDTHFDLVWDLFVEAVLYPAMPAAEIELHRKRQLASIDAMFENPDSHVGYLAVKSMFKGHAYHNMHMGTKETVASFTREDVRAYHRMLLDPKRMVLVVVSPLEDRAILAKVSASLGKLKPGNYVPKAIGDVEPKGVSVVTAVKALPTHYIFGLFPAPRPGQADYAAMTVAMNYLSDRLFEEIRSQRGLTYAVSSGLSDRRSNYGYLYVTAAKPKETIAAIYAEIKRLQEVTLGKEVIERTLNVYITEYYMGQQSNGSQASMLAEAHIVAGDWKRAPQFLSDLRKVTPADVQRVLKTYLKNYQFAVVGPTETFDDAVFAQ